MPKLRWALTACLLYPAPALAAQVTCREPSERSDEARRYLVFLATSSDTEAVHIRSHTGLPSVPARTIALIARDSMCAEAGAAIKGLMQTPIQSHALWLFSYGTGYAALTPDIPYEYGTPLFLFDQKWEQIFAVGFYGFP